MNEKNAIVLSGLSMGLHWIHQKIRGKNPNFLDHVKTKGSNVSFRNNVAFWIAMQFLI